MVKIIKVENWVKSFVFLDRDSCENFSIFQFEKLLTWTCTRRKKLDSKKALNSFIETLNIPLYETLCITGYKFNFYNKSNCFLMVCYYLYCGFCFSIRSSSLSFHCLAEIEFFVHRKILFRLPKTMEKSRPLISHIFNYKILVSSSTLHNSIRDDR